MEHGRRDEWPRSAGVVLLADWVGWRHGSITTSGGRVSNQLGDKIIGGSLPYSELAAHSLMDSKGNVLPLHQAKSSGRVPEGWAEQRMWSGLMESMKRDTPRTYGGHRHGLEPVTIEQLAHKRRVDGLLARVFAPAVERQRRAA